MALSIDAINRNGALLLGLTALPIAFMTRRSLQEQSTEEEKLELEQEKIKRALRVAENVSILKGIEEMEEKQKKDKSEQESLKDSEKSGGLSLSAVAEKEKEEEEEKDEDDDDDEEDEDDMAEGTITFDNHGEKIEELANINPSAPELEEGIEWAGKLALRELQIAIRKTRDQKDQAYADGSKVQEMLDYNQYRLNNFDSISSKYKIPVQIRQQIREEEQKGWKVRRVQLWNGVFKGLKIIAQARECIPWVAGSMTVSAMKSYISTSAQIYQASVMDALIKGDRTGFVKNAKATVIVEIFSSMVGVLERQLNNASQSQVSQSLSLKLCKSLLSKDMTFWKECKNPYNMIGKLFSLPYEVRSALEAPQRIVTQAVSIITMMIELSRKSGSMYKVLALLQIIQIGVRKLIDYMNEHFDRYMMAKIISPTQDQFSFFSALKPEFAQMFQAFARTQKEVKSYSRFMKANNRREQLSGVVSAVMEPVNTLTAQATRMVEYNTMKGLMESGQIDFNEAQNLLSYASQAASNLQYGYQQVKDLSTTMDPLAAAYDIINIAPSIDLNAGFIPDERAKGHFVFEKVTFRYPGKIGNALLLKDVSFEAKQGQVVGITGASGCGKSTVLRLIQRFYDVTEGRILLDGRDIREYNPEWLRSQIVTVDQEPKLLPMTIRENLIFGCKKEPTMEQIQKACESAQIWDILSDKEKFPEFLETKMYMVSSVAGGEKQRMCIARAILMDPPILLLDEATSALDEVAQQKVQEALNVLMESRTTLVVAHRLSTIKDANKIIGMKDGVVIDDGTHQELLAKKDSEPNVWKSLWKTSQGVDQTASAVPKLQRTTTTTTGKFAVLRSALAASLPADKAGPMITLVNELENGGASDDDFKTHLEAAGLHMSRWSKVRGAVLAGAVGGSDSTRTPLTLHRSASPELHRSASLADQATTKLTRAISNNAGIQRGLTVG